jgi:NADH dehydrogenase
MRVGLIGGTGFVGGYLVDRLIESGHQPVVLVRSGNEGKLSQANRCEAITGDVDSPSAITEICRGSDVVIYNVGILRENRRQGITFEKLQFEAAERTVKAACENGVRRFILMSANGVKEGGTPYQDTKFRAEQAVRRSGLEWTIFRPSVIFGDPRGQMEFATQLYRDMVAPPIPGIGFFKGLSPSRGQLLMSPVHVTDVATAFIRAVDGDSLAGQLIELGGPEILSWTNILTRIAEACGKKKWILPMPVGLMQMAAFLLDWAPVFPVTRDQLTMLAEGNTVEQDVLPGLTGHTPTPFTAEHLRYLVDSQ